LGLTAYSNIDVWLLFLERFCFVVAITIPFDIRDIERDKDRGLKTLPISLGAFPSLVFSLGLLVMVLMLALIQAYVGNVFDKDHLIQLFVALLITAIIVMETKQTNNDYFFSGLVESTMLLFAIALGMA
jgi:4-hydroxybenzoate polyprenyltransferase